MKLWGRRVLVTGGAGFIGSHLVEALVADNDVTVLDDLTVGREENLPSGASRVRLVRGDVTDPSSIEAAVAEAEVIFHLAVVCLREAIGNPMRCHEVNSLGTLNVLQAARKAPHLERFVYVSSSEVYGTSVRAPMDEEHPALPKTPYAASKLAGEAYTLSFWHTYRLPATVIRPFNAYGPRAHMHGVSGELIPRFVAMALAGQPLVIFGDGEQSRDFTWVQDTARGIVMGAECDALVGDRVNIARGADVSVLRIAKIIQEILRTSVAIQHLPSRPGDVQRHRADVTRSRQMLGFEAAVGIEEGLRRYIDWVTSQPNHPPSRLADEEIVNWRVGPLPL